MKLAILALDYDGTIAGPHGLDPAVRKALAEVRAREITVVLVTGRRLAHLREDVGDLRFVDAVVAENGAVLAFPQSGRSTVIGAPPPPAFLEALRQAGVDAIAGECIVEADASQRNAILEAIHRLELPLVMLFNRGRVMVLPQAISKATGLREAVRALRLSVHNAVAVGDAENDHELLSACELGAAVAWGSEALKARADVVVQGEGPADVAAFIREVASRPRVAPPRRDRLAIHLGLADDDSMVSLTVGGRNVLVAGDPRSGKSWAAGLIAEQLILRHYSVCIIDPEGDYRALEGLPGVIVVGGDDPLPRLREVTRALRYPDMSVVVDLSRVAHRQKCEYVGSLLEMLRVLRRHTGLPHRIVLDEAHYFLGCAASLDPVDLELGGYTLISYRCSLLSPEVMRACEAVIVTRETDAGEVRALREVAGSRSDPSKWGELLGGLVIGEAALLPNAEEARGRLVRFRLAPRLTFHVRHRHKYLDVPVPEGQGFLFAQGDEAPMRKARTVKDFLGVLKTSQPSLLDGYLQRGDFSRWFADVYGDAPLAAAIRRVEQEYKLGATADVNDALVEVIERRYVSDPELG